VTGIGTIKHLTVDLNTTRRARAESGENLDEFTLTIAGNTGDRHDLTAADIERYGAERRQASVALGREFVDRQDHWCAGKCADSSTLNSLDLTSDHHSGE
jgi:hypothetical protein